MFQLVGNQPQWHRLHELSAVHDAQNGKEYVIEPDKIVSLILLDELFEWQFLVNLYFVQIELIATPTSAINVHSQHLNCGHEQLVLRLQCVVIDVHSQKLRQYRLLGQKHELHGWKYLLSALF